MERMIEKALSLVGQGYIYGAKGQTCSSAFRQQQAQQYPEQAENILGTGAKWDGVPVWDCAQLVRAAAREAGLEMVSGATSQWNRTDWAEKGTISQLAGGVPAIVFRQADGRMQHVGLALGDGTCIHARGTAYGVVQQEMGGYAWTHYGIPRLEKREVLWRGVAHAASGSSVNIRREPGGAVIGRMALGSEVDVVGEAPGWLTILHGGGIAYMNSAFVRRQDMDWNALCERVKNLEARLEKAGL